MENTEKHNAKVCELFHNAIEIIGKRWTGAIISVLFSGPKRFSEFTEAIPELSTRLLTERLKEMEDFGLIRREVSQERPIQVIYSLTEKGEALKPIMESVGKWAHDWNNSEKLNKV